MGLGREGRSCGGCAEEGAFFQNGLTALQSHLEKRVEAPISPWVTSTLSDSFTFDDARKRRPRYRG